MVKVDTLQGASCSRIFNDATLDSAAKELETPLASTPPSIWILPHGAPHGAIHELRRTVHCRLRPAPGAARRVLEITERRAIRRSRDARASAHHDCQPEPAATTCHRRCWCALPRRSRSSPIWDHRLTRTGISRRRLLLS